MLDGRQLGSRCLCPGFEVGDEGVLVAEQLALVRYVPHELGPFDDFVKIMPRVQQRMYGKEDVSRE